ncbi:Zn-dependent protease with chaperone function [Sphingopyxis italica]|uniref:Zn-dependent protease with chaperone function n=1 Tax=Sphingopyxis italica TaxID=1129133 RepID=A0A7X5XP73_9SPHN|nr:MULTISPECIES: hypothetical protein [Sphingopyxis]NJB88722.1 Zn-dependent protease with chaperone function [Sphingopyxis italica]HET6525089.1 hypothetical protein [Sphingopyxis sp.]
MSRRELLLMLAAWAIVSAMIFTLGVGFAGGLEHVFSLPSGEPVSIAFAVIGWVFILCPVVAIPLVLLRGPK